MDNDIKVEIDKTLMSDFQREVFAIRNKEKRYNLLWKYFSSIDKVFSIINFGTLLYSVIFSNSRIGLILSIYTLSFSMVCNNGNHLSTLEKLVHVYQDHIIPRIEELFRNMLKNREFCYDVQAIKTIETEMLNTYMGKDFILSNTLRDMNYKKVCVIIVAYIIMFICIPVIYHYAAVQL